MKELERGSMGRLVRVLAAWRTLGLLAGFLLLLAACAAADIPAGPADGDDVLAPPAAEPLPEASAPTPVLQPGPASQPTAVPAIEVPVEATRYPADDPRIRYIGRFDFQNPRQPQFDWSGTGIEFAFNGTDLVIVLDELDGINAYNVTVDGRGQVLKTEKGPGRYRLAEGLAPGEHHFRLVKRTEPVLGAVAFSGVEIAGDGLLEPPLGPGRRIEFIGDSITTGFGNEGDSPECAFSLETQNAETTYAAMVAAELEAEYTLIAMSSLGVYNPLLLLGTSSSVTAVDLLDRALAFEPDVTWPPDKQTPDAVVLSLGTNDYSTEPLPEDEDYVNAYLELLVAVRERYPAAHIFAAAGPMVFHQGPQMIAAAVERFQAANGDERITYVFIEDNLERSAEDFGCAWHPNVHGHQKIAAQLTPAMAAQLGW